MKKNIDRVAWVIFFVPFVLASGMLQAQNRDDDECPTNITVGSRVLTMEQRAQLAQYREEQAQEDLIDDEETEEEIIAKSSLFKEFYQLNYSAFHRPAAIAIDGSTLELEDGSTWSLKYTIDMISALSWSARDSIVIEQYDYYGIDYKIRNQTRDEYIIATPIFGPVFSGIYTHWITSIDSFGTIKLEDGSEWNAFTSSEIALWQPNDTIVVGAYNGGASYNTILINVNLLDYARVKLNWKR